MKERIMSMQKYPNSLKARQATRLFPRTITATPQQTKHLRRSWLNAIEYLGPKWVLSDANKVQKKGSAK
jgi:hypothetical protein